MTEPALERLVGLLGHLGADEQKIARLRASLTRDGVDTGMAAAALDRALALRKPRAKNGGASINELTRRYRRRALPAIARLERSMNALGIEDDGIAAWAAVMKQSMRSGRRPLPAGLTAELESAGVEDPVLVLQLAGIVGGSTKRK